MKSQLLPEGFRDSLPDLAELENHITSIFIDLMKFNGFQLVKPPLIEFESSLFFLKKHDSDNIDSFRVMDPLTQKIMGIRSDITLQIARVSCGSLSKNIRPLRLCYAGEVLKVKNNSINLSRQFTQVGAEIIGIQDHFCLSELINLIIENLDKLGIKKFILNFSMPNLINVIAKDFKLSKEQFDILVNCYRNKNLFEIKNISEKLFQLSEFLLSSIGRIEEKIGYIKKYKFSKNIKSEVVPFIDQIKKIKDELKNLDIIIDPLEIDDSNYHSGFCFKVYSENTKELFSGGGYKVGKENCIGFSGFLENLIFESSIKMKKKIKIFIPFNLDLKKKNFLQKKKKLIIIRSIQKLNKDSFVKEAKKQDCQYYFYNNLINEVK